MAAELFAIHVLADMSTSIVGGLSYASMFVRKGTHGFRSKVPCRGYPMVCGPRSFPGPMVSGSGPSRRYP